MTFKKIWYLSFFWQLLLYIIILFCFLRPMKLQIINYDIVLYFIVFSVGILSPISILLILKRSYYIKNKTNKFSKITFFIVIFIFSAAINVALPSIVLVSFAFYIFTLIFTYKVAFLKYKLDRDRDVLG